MRKIPAKSGRRESDFCGFGIGIEFNQIAEGQKLMCEGEWEVLDGDAGTEVAGQ